MPRRNAARERLLAEVKQRQGAAADKLYRLRQQGIDTTGIDPRVPARDLATMNARELRSQLGRVNRFQSRGNQYEAGYRGSPLPRADVQAYRAAEALNNQRSKAIEDRIRDIKLPGQDLTIGGLLEMRRAPRGAGSNQQSRVQQEIHRNMGDVVDADALRQLTRTMQDKNSRGYLKRALEPRMNSLRALLINSGNGDLLDKVNRLTDEQKRTLLDYSTFTQIAQERFSSGDDAEVSAEDAAYEERTGHSRQADVRQDLDAMFDWVLNVDLARRSSTGTEYTDTTAKANPIIRQRQRSPRKRTS